MGILPRANTLTFYERGNLMMKFGNLSACLALALIVLTAGLPAQAGMVATDQIQKSGVATEFVDVSTQRDWIEARLLQGGIAQPEAINRVSAMTDVEVAQIYQRIDEAPAGGNILVIALVIFAVLEITGYIDVIPER
jgi:hypothetical protein